MSLNAWDLEIDASITSTSPKSLQNYLEKTTQFVSDLIQWKPAYDEDCSSILNTIQPYDSQLAFRTAVFAVLKQQVRNALSTLSYEIGYYPLQAFLPDDPIKLTLVICQGQMAYWHSNLSDRMKMVAESGDFDYQLCDVPDELYQEIVSKLSNINVINEPSGYKVLCSIDGLEIEISANARTDLCLNAFLDEIAVLVGQNNLFKKAILLVRSWWYYETSQVVNSAVSHYLSDSCLMIMIVAVFNVYHASIKTPLQAFYLFLKMYENYDGKNEAITVQGKLFRSFSSLSRN